MKRKNKYLTLLRSYGVAGTNGILSIDGNPICYTIELPWRDNQQRISCIPEGVYRLAKHVYSKFGEQIGIPAVAGRSGILIHAANHAMRELQGCIAPVSSVTAAGQGLQSRVALAQLKAIVYALWGQGYTVYLQIKAGQQGELINPNQFFK